MEFHFRVRDGGCLISRSRITRALFSNLRTGYETEIASDPTSDWICIQALQWRLRSEGPLDSMDSIMERLLEFGGTARVRAALERCAAPLERYTGAATAWQIAALGEKAVAAALESPPLIEFLEKELQPVDIIELLK
jgi:hypothetical protein